MKIGIIGAMLAEIDLIKKDIKIEDEKIIGMRQYYSGTLYGRDVVLVFSRWGKVAAASTVTTLIENFGVDIIVFTGVAGAASAELRVGDIVIADKLLQHDMDVSPLGSLDKYVIPLLNKQYFEVEPKVLELAERSALHYIRNVMRDEIEDELLQEFSIKIPKVITGTIASGDQFIADSARINELNASVKNLKCVEMEGAAVAQVCFEHEIPFIVLRVVSDNANETANIDFEKFIERIGSYFTRGIIKKLVLEL